jgi:hypothetical protein
LGHFRALESQGVNRGTVGRSLFAFPGYIWKLARCDLPDLYTFDLVNAHPAITLRRHPSMQHLGRYVHWGDEVLAAIPAPRSLAKELFIRLLYGGTAEAWCAEHGVELSSLPPFVEAFAEDVAKVREADLRNNGGGEIGALQHRLNTTAERQAIDAVEKLSTPMSTTGCVLHCSAQMWTS